MTRPDFPLLAEYGDGSLPNDRRRTLQCYRPCNGSAKHRQWPISARPIQLNANREDAIATTNAMVTKVLTDSMIDPVSADDFVEPLLFYQGGNSSLLKF
jgi:hypothetical protein